jgi:hypothetical protein
MKLKRSISLAFLVFSSQFLFSQETIIYDQYPPLQEAYVGREKLLYKEIHDILIENKFQKCEDSTQSYRVKLIVKQDSSILFVKNPDSVYVEKNKCAYQLSKKVLPYLKNWRPAEHNKEKLNAIYEFNFTPSDLFENYNENYMGFFIDRNIPQFPGGINEFRKQFQNKFDPPFLGIKYITGEIVFSINNDGKIVDIKVVTTPYNPKYEKGLITAIQKISTKWIIPKGYDYLKKPYHFRLPISFTFD